jgi:ferredoxin-like protein FixX
LLRHVVDKESHISVDQAAHAKCAEKVCLNVCLANVYSCVESKMFVAH